MEQIALITGASRGFGAALAEELAAAGWHVLAVARTTGALEELDDRIKARGGQATLAPMDVTDDGAMQHLCRSIHERWGHLDLWVHTAIHVPPLSPADHIDGKDWAKTVATGISRRRQRSITPRSRSAIPCSEIHSRPSGSCSKISTPASYSTSCGRTVSSRDSSVSNTVSR